MLCPLRFALRRPAVLRYIDRLGAYPNGNEIGPHLCKAAKLADRALVFDVARVQCRVRLEQHDVALIGKSLGQMLGRREAR